MYHGHLGLRRPRRLVWFEVGRFAKESLKLEE